jgi:hypothetical protein
VLATASAQRVAIAARLARGLRDDPSLRVVERDAAPGRPLDVEAAAVDQHVMEPAEPEQVVELRFTAVGPVLDVMGVRVVALRAAGKHARLVARVKSAPQRRRDRARLPAERDRLAVALDHPDDARVARQPACGCNGQRHPVVEAAAAHDRSCSCARIRAGAMSRFRGTARAHVRRFARPRFRGTAQCIHIDVHDDLIDVRRRRALCELRARQRHQCVRIPGARRRRLFRGEHAETLRSLRRRWPELVARRFQRADHDRAELGRHSPPEHDSAVVVVAPVELALRKLSRGAFLRRTQRRQPRTICSSCDALASCA